MSPCRHSRSALAGLLLLLASALSYGQNPPVSPPNRLRLARTGAELSPELLSPVADLTNGFPAAERDCYYMLLAHAQTVPAGLQQRAARENQRLAEQQFRADRRNARRKHLLFYDIVTQPDTWRGQPVTLKGYIRDLTPMEAGENSYGLETLYQAHLFTEDSSQFPYIVICTRVPEALPQPTARRPTDYVTVTGYFYKLWTYRAGTDSGHWSAPLILARELEWNPPPPRPALNPRWYWLGGALGAAGLLGGWYLRVRNREARRLLRELNAIPESADADARTTLRNLERSE